MKYLLDILGDVPITVGDFCVLNDFIVLDMAKDVYNQIILGKSFLATFGYKIDVKGGQLTFDMGKSHAEFTLFEY